jgi:Tfp pilus assembly protein PilP
MRWISKFSSGVLIVVLWSASGSETANAQDHIATPSQKTKHAVDAFTKTPSTIGKSLGALTEAASAKLKQVFTEKPEIQKMTESDDTSTLLRKNSEPQPPKYMPRVTRDPFRPPSIQTRTISGSRENLSPLERFELGQLKVVGIIWDVKEPRAMIEDTAGLGYTVLLGTPIGGSQGKVKAIRRNEVIIEESFEDFSGKKKTREVSMKLSVLSAE